MSILGQYDGYEKEVMDCISQVMASRMNDEEKVNVCCDWLIAYAKEHDEPKLAAFAYYYKAEASLNHSDRAEIGRLLVEGLKYQQYSGDHELEARSYNVLGVIAHERKNYVTALEYYFTAMEIGQTYGLTYMDGVISTNIGGIYEAIGDFEQAIAFYTKGISIIAKETEKNSFAIWNLLNLNISVARCYLKVGHREKVLCYKREVERMLEEALPETYEPFAVHVFLYEMALLEKQKEKAKFHKKQAADCLRKPIHTFEFSEDIVCFCRLLLAQREYEQFLSLVEFVQEKIAKLDLVQTRLDLMELKLSYYEDIGNEEYYNRQAKEMLDLMLKQQQENEKSVALTIELKQHLQKIKNQQTEIMKCNEALLLKVQLDPMTGIANRGKLNEYAEEKFEEAKKNGTYFGVSILDVDYFKQYNDYYGHMEGDACITAIAKVLKEISVGKIFCARYGGDEFVLVFDNMTMEEVHKVLDEVQVRIQKCNLAHHSSPISAQVTVTLGCINAVPTQTNRLWDYMHKADLTLYQAKNAGKNRAMIVGAY